MLDDLMTSGNIYTLLILTFLCPFENLYLTHELNISNHQFNIFTWKSHFILNTTQLELWLQSHWRQWLQPLKQRMLAPWKESYDRPRQCIKKKRHHFTNRSPHSESHGFSSSHIWMWELDQYRRLKAKELMLLNCGAIEDSWESPLDSREIKPVNTKGNGPWRFIGRLDAEALASILWPLYVKSLLIRKDPDAGEDWR